MFIILGAGRPHIGSIHASLKKFSHSHRVLDWKLNIIKKFSKNILFVGGYEIDKVKINYPQLNYFYNEEWETSGSAWSLLNSPFDSQKDIIVSYADIVFNEKTLSTLISKDDPITIVVDTKWENRYIFRKKSDLSRCEKVILDNKKVKQLTRKFLKDEQNAEFIGLVKFNSQAVRFLSQLNINDRQKLRKSHLSELIEFLRLKGLAVKFLDIKGDWAELNKKSDLARFILGTKAETLKKLQPMVKLSKIENQISFTVKDWLTKEDKIIKDLQNQFDKNNVIVRSSTLKEDSFLSSNAGSYKSILDVKVSCKEELKGSIQEVILSYKSENSKDQILVQKMIHNVKASGVIFTRGLDTGSPYYIINYDDVSGKTDSITSGRSINHKTIYLFRNKFDIYKKIPKVLNKLILSVREIEALLNYDALDVEFGITKNDQVNILQVRPIIYNKKYSSNKDGQFLSYLENAEKSFIQLQESSPFVKGKGTIFSNMTDWNPAEIIGSKPSILSNSLYMELITNDIWSKQRAYFGYKDVRPQHLITSFCGQPYVDVRASLNSFIPADLSDNLTAKLVDFYLDSLIKKPELHDKVEFYVVPTCYALDFGNWEIKLTKSENFNSKEIEKLKQSLIKITLKSFNDLERNFSQLEVLDARFKKIQKTSLSPLMKAFAYFDDAKLYGAMAFSNLARNAFIAVSFLKSAVETEVISKREYDDFMNSIKTISHEFVEDAIAFGQNQVSWDKLIKKYSHLRPGTYDITSKSYGKDPEKYLLSSLKKIASENYKSNNDDQSSWKKVVNKIFIILKNHNFNINIKTLENFMRKSIEGREYSKFLMTRNLSYALDEFELWSEKINLDLDTLSGLTISDLRNIKSGLNTFLDIEIFLKERSDHNRKNADVLSAIELPPLLISKDDFYIFNYPNTKPNFIGQSSVTSKTVFVNNDNVNGIENSIVLLERGDPGFEWLFGEQINGLITMFGGANSHMAVRAAEFGIPAALGVGKIEFEKLIKSKHIELNAGKRFIRVIY